MNLSVDILPLFRHLAQEKSVHSGLFVSNTHPSIALPPPWQQHTLASITTAVFTSRVDLAVVLLERETMADASLSIALTRLRDIMARRVLIITATTADTTALLRSLGFSQLQLPTELLTALGLDLQTGACWQFNILNYKQVPDWLNAKYWANPDNFDKYRW